MREKPALLFVTYDFPYPIIDGQRVRLYNLICALSKTFSLTLFSPLQGTESRENIEHVRHLCERLVAPLVPNKRSFAHRLFYRAGAELSSVVLARPPKYFYCNLPAIQKNLSKLLQEQDFAAIYMTYWYTSHVIRDYRGRAIRILDTQDVAHHRYEKELNARAVGLTRVWKPLRIRTYRGMEFQSLRSFDLVLAVTEQDRDYFRQNLTNEVVYLREGIDLEAARPVPALDADHPTLGFLGNMGDMRNFYDARYLCEKILPLVKQEVPEVRIKILGSNPTPEVLNLGRDPSVEVTGYVEDLSGALSDIQIMALPIQIATGVSVRILELLARGMPMVVSPEAINGIDVRPGNEIVLASSPEQFAGQIVGLLRDRRARAALGENARRFMREHYDVHTIYSRFSSLLLEKIRARKAGIASH